MLATGNFDYAGVAEANMRQTFIALLLATGGQSAWADVLDGHHGLREQLIHQFFGTHHFPLTLIVVLFGMLIIRKWHKARTGQH